MKQKNKQTTQNSSLLGVPTPEKAAGGAYSLAAILPIFVSLLIVIIGGIFNLLTEGYENKDWFLYLSYLCTPISFILVGVWYFSWTKTPVKQTILAQKTPIKYYVWALILQIGLFSLSQLNNLFLQFLQRFGYQSSEILLPNMDGVGIVFVVLVVAVLPAITEEVLFRGMLLNGLRSFGAISAALICGGLFALYHQNPAQTAYQFCCGFAFALVAIRSGSILPTVFSHFINNAVILLLTKFGVVDFTSVLFTCISSLCLVAALVYFIFIDKNMPKSNSTSTQKKGKTAFWIFAAVGVLSCAITWLTNLFVGM